MSIEKNNVKKYINDYKFIIILLVIILVVLIIPKKSVSDEVYTDSDKINQICKLVTLENLYHATGASKADGIPIIKFGYKKYWVEFDAKVKYGVDCSKIEVKKVDKVLKVKLPKAELLTNPETVDGTQIEHYEKGLFSIIDATEDKSVAKQVAIDSITESIDEDSLNAAYENGKEYIIDYYTNIAKTNGEKITVEFVE